MTALQQVFGFHAAAASSDASVDPDRSGRLATDPAAPFRSEYGHVGHADRRVIDPLIQAHYLGSWPAITRCVLGMIVESCTVGTVVFADAPPETTERYGGYTWELARLWVSDDVPRNAESWLIGQSVRHVRRVHSEVRVLVSYADPSAGHAGTIYRASNWTPDGRTDQGRLTPRSDYIDDLTGRKVSRRGHVRADQTVSRIPRVSKLRFVMRLAA